MLFKGDPFVNRYRFEGELIAQTPIHIGTGEVRQEERRDAKKDSVEPETQEIALIAHDIQGRPYLPGSTLRGVVRHYLLQVFRGFANGLAADPDFEKEELRGLDQNQQISYMNEKASLLEQLFGTSFCESKVEFWDAPAINTVQAVNYNEKGWDQKRQCYVVRSVAINPETGTAEAHKLYAFEVAPPGLRYNVNLVGQNLTEEELGFLIFGLNGFNSDIFPLTIGAMAGRGFGRMKFQLTKVYRMQSADLKQWAEKAVESDHAGYHILPLATIDTPSLIAPFKEAFQRRMGGAA